MKTIVLSISLATATLLLAQHIQYGDETLVQEQTQTATHNGVVLDESEKDIKLNTLQIVSTKTIQKAKKIFRSLPKSLQKDTHIYRVGDYIALRFKTTKTVRALKPYVKQFQRLGFKDAYVLQTTQWHMKKHLIRGSEGVHNEKPLTRSFTKPQQVQQQAAVPSKKPISQYLYAQLLSKADQAYKQGDESSSLSYYEMLYNTTNATQRVKNNLCYLYGKRGAWLDAQEVFKQERFTSNLVYAYAYGAVETHQPNFMEDMKEYIAVDRTGKLSLLAGYYYEQGGDMQNAMKYYTQAYAKNRSSWYNTYAYARVFDLAQNYPKAAELYKEVLTKIPKNNQNYGIIFNRIHQITIER